MMQWTGNGKIGIEQVQGLSGISANAYRKGINVM